MPEKKEMLAAVNIVVDLGDSQQALTRGEVVDVNKLPAGAVVSMTRLGQLVDADTVLVEPEAESEEKDEAGDKLLTTVDQLGLDADQVAALTSADLSTVADVLEFGKAHNGLQSIDGIGAKTEAKIQAAIETLLAE